MPLYHFQMIDPTGARHDIKSLQLADIGAVWREIDAVVAEQAHGGQIRVTNETGGIVVLVGVSTARSLRARRAA
ncbi:hypothetical protein K9U39_14560 [Rhodoblastus acidophilus]|uniref:Uncharacterized protein n=1 Tax=Candidatus Rhodoblastus alkanivorans TaxID=2954117 RepID=A0ABS9ZD89_9HYPH|nr:hypothetical protein [Candidatus Rhodoblastus alkanivorans]MCI4679350.1 hypothetical protein [Candidatus Rhodoblastus alkanivorans]MCI4684826.1 hypothetical protein [Candidatus Rhodoblastus alkanivorans]MDI4642150.1 hypothetical protein [Rhodoblastus acidophilus]